MKIVRFFLRAGLTGALVVLTVYFARYPNLPKIAAYRLFREYQRIAQSWQVRSWEELKSGRFTVRYRPGDEAAARLVLETAEEFNQPVEKALNFQPAGEIKMVLYPDTVSLNRSFGWAADESAMGVYWAGVIRILSPDCWAKGADESSRFKSEGPIAHEYAHLIVDYIANGNYPRWLTEGIAQQVERSVTGFEMPDNGNREIYPLSKMDTGFDLLPDQNAAYRQSLAMVDFLSDTFGADKMPLILKELGRGMTLDKAFQSAIGMNTAQFAAAFSRSQSQ